MADTILQANVELKIDTATVDKQIKDVSKKLESGLSKADDKLSKQLTKSIDRDLKKITKQIERSSEAASRVLERGLKFSLGIGTTALYTFLKSGTPEALKFANSLDRVKVVWSRVGQVLATKIKIGGATGQDWLNTLVNKLENLDTTQIEKALNYVKAMAALFLGFKGISIAIKGGELVGSITSAISNSIAKLNLGGTKNISGATDLAGTAGILAGAGAIGKTLKDSIKKEVAPVITETVKKAKTVLVDEVPGEDFAKTFRRARAQRRLESLADKNIQKTFGTLTEAEFDATGRYKPPKINPLFAESRLLSRFAPYRTGGVNIGLGAAGISASALYNAQNITASGFSYSMNGRGSGESWSAIGKTAATALGTLIAGPIGGAIATALSEGTDLITKGIAKFFEKPVEYYDKLLEKNRGPLWNSNFKSQALLDKEAREKTIQTLFDKSSTALTKSSVYKEFLSDQRSQYLGGKLPAFKLSTTGMVKNIQDKITELSALEEEMLREWNTFSTEEKTFRTTFKAQLDAVTAEKNAYLKEQEDQVNTWRESKDKEKKFNETIKEFDRQVIDARTRYENTLNDINKNKDFNKPLQTSISMGGDISSIPSIISSALNEQKNAQSEKLSEDFQKIIDTSLAQLQYQMDLFNLAAEEKKYREETLKQDRDDRKDIKTYVKEMRDAVTPRSSTVTVLK